MRGAVAFGLLLGIGGTLSRVFFGDRLAYVILFSLVALSSGAISLVVWRRLRLGLFTVSGLAAAAACGAIASFAWQGYTLETIPAA